MNVFQNVIIGTFTMLCSLLPHQSLAQWSNPATVGSRSELVLLYSYQWVTGRNGYQDIKIICKNITTDKIEFKISYEIYFHNGEVERVSAGSSIILQPGEILDPNSLADWGGVYKRYFLTPSGGKYGVKEKWFEFGKDSYDNPLYTAIHVVMNMKITDFVNISQKERDDKKQKEAEAKKKEIAEQEKKEEEQKNQKEAEAKKKEVTAQTTQQEVSDFWSDGTSSQASSSTSKSNAANNVAPKDKKFVAESNFKGGLFDLKEGDYFEDGKGAFFQRVDGGAKKVDKASYDKSKADKIYAGIEQRENEGQKREVAFNQMTEQVTTSSYYALTANSAHTSMRNAANLFGDFKNIEELNRAFSQQMEEIRRASQEMRSSSQAAMSNYTSSLASYATTSSDQTYATALGTLGAMASAIAANNEEKKAREELRRQQSEHEAKINENQTKALVAIRNQIDASFQEGWMPLSSHKVTAPVLYLFAYAMDKRNWESDVNIDVVLSNVIPVFRYSDGAYPYLSNVKKTFENGGVNNPKVIGYFTDKSQAETYRKGLIDVASSAKFSLYETVIKVKEKSSNDLQTTSSDADFWGTEKPKKTTPNKNTETEIDFWGVPIKKD